MDDVYNWTQHVMKGTEFFHPTVPPEYDK